MDRERQHFEGGLAVGQRKAKELELKIKGLLESVRLHLDPLEKIEELEIDIAFYEMAELSKAWTLYIETQVEIRKAKKILGRD